MNQNKICPHCEAEYLPHIESCADCETVLLSSEEHLKAQEKRKRTEEKIVENSVAVREGDLNWMTELRTVLIDSGIPCTIHFAAGCKKGCCGDKCRLAVLSEDLERAQESIEEYLMEINPEFRASKKLLSDGKCPACGSPVGTGDRECCDCGLPLLIVEEG